ncbi:MAG TPA: hypothetical protein VGR35_08830 [Tepidisphaeraceae bacterium]|nr:hypothetical protein [Tepidisphaeraceae bacterium]
MSPTELLVLVVILTVGLMVCLRAMDRRRRGALRRLASAWQMHYTPFDRFRLAPRVAPRLPVPGAAGVRIKDLIYGLEGDQLRYIFIAEYTTGTVAAQVRRESVATFAEPRERRDDSPVDLLLAPAGLSLIEQYQHLRKRVSPEQ